MTPDGEDGEGAAPDPVFDRPPFENSDHRAQLWEYYAIRRDVGPVQFALIVREQAKQLGIARAEADGLKRAVEAMIPARESFLAEAGALGLPEAAAGLLADAAFGKPIEPPSPVEMAALSGEMDAINAAAYLLREAGMDPEWAALMALRFYVLMLSGRHNNHEKHEKDTE